MTGAASGGGRRRSAGTAGVPGAGAETGGRVGPRAGRARDTSAEAAHRDPPRPEHAVADTVVVYTDGACKGNPGPGGWGALLRHGVHERELFGGEVSTTNNRMELLAVIRALEALKRPCRVEVYTDSRYVQQGIRDWIHNWKKNGWRTADRKPVKNVELWQELDRVASRHSIEWHWVKGHADNPGNVRADALANKGAQGAGARAPGRED